MSRKTFYDYVIVGAGSAGSIMANRLAAANPSAKVALLEAGPTDHTPLIKTPLLIGFLVGFSRKYNYRYFTQPEKACGNREIYWPRGRGLGGSSSINGMVYIRGQKQDYDHWAELTDDSWSFNNVLPLFKRVENNSRGESTFHGATGELSVTDLQYKNKFSTAFIQSCVNAGIPLNDDFNGAEQEGVGFYQTTIKAGSRHNSSYAFLHNTEKPNLDIITDATTTKVLIENNKAVGVEYISSRGGKSQVQAEKEIVVCGGTINSPQILNMSGIGDAQELRDAGIDCIVHLPGVGKNLIDHIDYTGVFNVNESGSYGFDIRDLPNQIQQVGQYYKDGTGMFTSNAAEAGVFMKSSPDKSRPDLQFHFLPGYCINDARNLKYGSGISGHFCILRPKSRGSIKVASNDIRQSPHIYANYFSHPDDMKDMVKGFRHMQTIFSKDPIKSFITSDVTVSGFKTPGVSASDAEIETYLRNRCGSVYHPVGTCKMGKATETSAVVDSSGKVFGVKNLRVADASIMPTIPSGNTNAPVIMIGEKIAQDMIAEALGQTLSGTNGHAGTKKEIEKEPQLMGMEA